MDPISFHSPGLLGFPLIVVILIMMLEFKVGTSFQCPSSFRCNGRYSSSIRYFSTTKFLSKRTETDHVPLIDDEVELFNLGKAIIRETKPGTITANDAMILRQCMNVITQKEDNRFDFAPIMQILLFRMIDEIRNVQYTDNDDVDYKSKHFVVASMTPCIEDFITAMKLWEEHLRHDLNQRKRNTKQSVVKDLIELYESLSDLVFDFPEFVQLKHNTELFQVFFRVLSVSRDRGIDKVAWKYFKEMQYDYKIPPNPSTYHSMIVITAKSRERGAANRAEKLLRDAVEQYPPSIIDGVTCGMNIDSFNVVLTSWAKSGLDYGPERAEKLISYIDEIDAGRGILQPTVSTFTSLIDAYAQTNDWVSVSHGERIFNRVLDMHLEGGENFEPGIVAWTILMNAWVRLSKKGNRGAASRADKMFRRMETLYEQNRISFGPDAVVYVTCMNAHAFSKSMEGAIAAREILIEMNERYMDGDDTFQPTPRSIKIVLDSLIRLDQMDSATELLQMLEDHLDTTNLVDGNILDEIRDIYKSMIFGWAKNSNPQQAQIVLLDMIQKGLRPDSSCFDRVIESNTQNGGSGAMKRSLEVFDTMEKCRMKGYVQPNERVYTSFVRAMIKANVPGMANKSRSLIRHMEKLYNEGNVEIQPTIYTYNAVLLACAGSINAVNSTTDRVDAYNIAMEFFYELKQNSIELDHVTFGNLLRCTNLLSPGTQKDEWIVLIFQWCCSLGYVNEFVIRDLINCATDNVWETLLIPFRKDYYNENVNNNNNNVDNSIIQSIPSSWRYQLEEGRRKKT